MTVPKLETLADGLNFLQPMFEQYAHDKGVDAEENVLLIKRHLARRMDEIRRMGEGCRTVGDLKRRIGL